MGSEHEQPEIRAAGAVLWRYSNEKRPEVAIVHRDRHNDWSLPKGKLDTGEVPAIAAVREVFEETGYAATLGRFLSRVEYRVPSRCGSRTVNKTVDYFSAYADSGQFRRNDEVDELRWYTPEDAERMLSYPSDSEVLHQFCALPVNLGTMLLVRHAKAGKRADWTGDDDLRPLSPVGLRQAEALRELIRPFKPDRVLSAPRLRCVRTVQGFAEDLRVDITQDDLLSEESFRRDPQRTVTRLLKLAEEPGTPLVSSQGGVIPSLISRLAARSGMRLNETKSGTVPSKKASLWLLSFKPASAHEVPKLVAASYFPSPLPIPDAQVTTLE